MHQLRVDDLIMSGIGWDSRNEVVRSSGLLDLAQELALILSRTVVQKEYRLVRGNVETTASPSGHEANT